MKTMIDYDQVRAMYFKEGLSKRAIARETGFHRDTVKKMIELSAPPGYCRQKEPERPVLGPFVPVIDSILESDKPPTPKKQRHTSLLRTRERRLDSLMPRKVLERHVQIATYHTSNSVLEPSGSSRLMSMRGSAPKRTRKGS